MPFQSKNDHFTKTGSGRAYRHAGEKIRFPQGDIEGAWYLANHSLVALSEQAIISCGYNKTGDDHGCGGGMGEKAFKYVIMNAGLPSEEDYPFIGKTGHCNHTAEAQIAGGSISSWYQVSGSSDEAGSKPPNEENILQQLSKVGPISIVVDTKGMQDYKGGALDLFCATCILKMIVLPRQARDKLRKSSGKGRFLHAGIDDTKHCKADYGHCEHSVLIVGYGTENSTDYWKIKNRQANTRAPICFTPQAPLLPASGSRTPQSLCVSFP